MHCAHSTLFLQPFRAAGILFYFSFLLFTFRVVLVDGSFAFKQFSDFVFLFYFYVLIVQFHAHNCHEKEIDTHDSRGNGTVKEQKNQANRFNCPKDSLKAFYILPALSGMLTNNIYVCLR